MPFLAVEICNPTFISCTVKVEKALRSSLFHQGPLNFWPCHCCAYVLEMIQRLFISIFIIVSWILRIQSELTSLC